MRKPAIWAWVVVAGMLHAVVVNGNDSVPAPRPVDDIWLPRPKAREPKDWTDPIESGARSVFPALFFVRCPFEKNDDRESYNRKYDAARRKAWPRLFGDGAPKADPTDSALQQLLKLQLRQGALEYRGHIRAEEAFFAGPPPPFIPPFDALKGIRVAALALWSDKPSELIPWLEELVLAATLHELRERIRAEAGASEVYKLNYATRLRLTVEADLWRAKNPTARRDPNPPAKKDDTKAKPAEGDWLGDKKLPPTLFPNIELPPTPKDAGEGWDVFAVVRSWSRFATACPRLSGNSGLTIEATDDTLRRLLKARLHQGAVEMRRYRATEVIRGYGWEFEFRYDCMDDLLATAVELFGSQPKELVPWLEELLIDAKEWERYMQLRADTNSVRSASLNQASRHRLKIEAELWKAKNAK